MTSKRKMSEGNGKKQKQDKMEGKKGKGYG